MEMAELCLRRGYYMGIHFSPPRHSSFPSPKDPGVLSSRIRHARLLALYILSSPGPRFHANTMEMAKLCLRRALYLARSQSQPSWHCTVPGGSRVHIPSNKHARRMHFSKIAYLGQGLILVTRSCLNEVRIASTNWQGPSFSLLEVLRGLRVEKPPMGLGG